MAIPKDWSVKYHGTNNDVIPSDPRAICPHCRNASTFAIRAHFAVPEGQTTQIHLFLQCNYGACKRMVYVRTALNKGQLAHRPGDPFFMYPSRSIDPPHPSLPPNIAADWVEAQRALEASAPKAAAVMFRRVLYGVLIDKQCKLRPLHEGLTELIQRYRLPTIFDDWLPAIKDDGHDWAHPDRALQISTENVSETMEYTSELLRFLSIEPYEFQQRKSRSAAGTSTEP